MYGQNKRKEEKGYGKKAVQLNNTLAEEQKKEIELQSQIDDCFEFYGQRVRHTFGQLLKLNMKAAKISIENFSDIIGLSEREIGRMRQDKVEVISFRIIIAMCIVLRLTIDKAEELLNTKRYSLRCEELYVQVCKIFLLQKLSLSACNRLLKTKGLAPLTDKGVFA